MPKIWSALAEHLRVWFGLAVLAMLTFSCYAQPNISGAYQRSITISHSNVYESDQTDFPVLISGTYAFLANVQNGGNVQNPNGYDILFSSDPEAQQLLDFEIDTYDPATGAINFWVRIPTLSHTADTTIYMTYGIPGVAASYENKAGVWKNNFLSVYHLGNGNLISESDSGSAGYALSVSGSPTAVAGPIGGGAAFSGDAGTYLYHDSVPAFPSGAAPVTTEVWAQEPTLQEGCGGEAVGYGENSGDGSRVGLYFAVSNTLSEEFSSIGFVSSNSLPLDANWHHYAAVYGGGVLNASADQLYVDGVPIAIEIGAGTPAITTTQFKIGGIPTVTSACGFKGGVDEVRVSSGIRSAGWIATEYANQSAPSSFYTVSGSPTITQLSPSSGMAGTWVTITGTNFGSAQLASTVTFNGLSAIAEIWSDNYLKVQVPEGATSGNVVVTVNGTPSNGLPFTIITIRDGLISLTVSAGAASVKAGGSQAYSAIATYSDNSTQDVTSVATWSASDPTVAAVDSTGLLTAIDNGTATIQATVGGITGSTTLTVTPGPLDVVITPVYPAYPTSGTSAFSGQKTVAIGLDGFARFAAVDSTPSGWASGTYDDEVVYVRCLDPDCTTSHTTAIPIGHTMTNYSLALGPDGYAKVAITHNGGVGLIQCGDDDCSNKTNSSVDSNGAGLWVSIAAAKDGRAFVLYDKESTNGGDDAVNLATCSGGSCSTAQIASIPWYDNMGGAVTLGADGNPAIIYENSGSFVDGTSDSVHYYANGSDVVVSSNGSGGFWVQDIAIGPDGFARLAYVNNESGVDFIQCTNAACSTWTTATIPSSGTSTEFVSVAVVSDGTSVLQTSQVNSDNTESWWDYIQCATRDCSQYSDEIANGSLVPGHSLVSVALDQNGDTHMIAQAVSASDGPGGSGAVIEHALVGQECPTSINMPEPHKIRLEDGGFNSGLRTGVGIVATMQVGPSTKNWNGTRITEDVVTAYVSPGCPDAAHDTHKVVGCSVHTDFTEGAAAFHVGSIVIDNHYIDTPGARDITWGAVTTQMNNVFYDWHTRPVTGDSVLAPGGECLFVCGQTYKCRKKMIPGGVFTITYDLKSGIYNSTTAVTTVDVDKR